MRRLSSEIICSLELTNLADRITATRIIPVTATRVKVIEIVNWRLRFLKACLIFCVRYLRRLSITILQRVCNCAVHPFQMRRLFRTALVHILSHRWSRLAVFGRGDPEALFKNIAEVIRLRIAHFPSNYIRLIIRRV